MILKVSLTLLCMFYPTNCLDLNKVSHAALVVWDLDSLDMILTNEFNCLGKEYTGKSFPQLLLAFRLTSFSNHLFKILKLNFSCRSESSYYCLVVCTWCLDWTLYYIFQIHSDITKQNNSTVHW